MQAFDPAHRWAVIAGPLLAALLTPQASAAPPPAVRARANLGSYFSTDDYPPDARRARVEGWVEFRLTISPEGRVVGCEITGGIRFPSLDAMTCRLLRARARYRPARDAAGNAVQDTDNGRVHWQLPPD